MAEGLADELQEIAGAAKSPSKTSNSRKCFKFNPELDISHLLTRVYLALLIFCIALCTMADNLRQGDV